MAGGAWVLRWTHSVSTNHALHVSHSIISDRNSESLEFDRARRASRRRRLEIPCHADRCLKKQASPRRWESSSRPVYYAIDALLLDGVVRTGRVLRLVPDARIQTESQHEGVLRTEPDDGRANGRGRRRARQRLVYIHITSLSRRRSSGPSPAPSRRPRSSRRSVLVFPTRGGPRAG